MTSDLTDVPAQALYDELVRRGAVGAVPMETHTALWFDGEQVTPGGRDDWPADRVVTRPPHSTLLFLPPLVEEAPDIVDGRFIGEARKSRVGWRWELTDQHDQARTRTIRGWSRTRSGSRAAMRRRMAFVLRRAER